MRLLIFELRPAELEKIGLIGALQARLDAVETRAGLSTALDADPALRAPLGVEDALYRIAQEALNNALRHAQARTVRLSVQRTDGTIVMEVADDGRGFDPASTAGGGGIGLHTMVERAEQVGGQTRIDSQPGSGTRVRVEVPL
jgi:signal transduction histidine kinase